MSTVPIIAPDGSLGDVPYEHMMDAIKAGGKPAVTVKDPSGNTGVIPADRVQDAVKAGASIVPLQNQEAQHPGFWATVADDMKGLLHPSGFSPYPGMDTEAKSAAATQAAQQDQSRQAAGYSVPYRAAAPVVQALGVNVPGMEDAAKQGDPTGVLAHAAAGAAPIVAGEAISQGYAPAAKAISDAIPSTERAGAAFQEVSAAAGKHTVPVTDGLSGALARYQQLVDAGGSRSLTVSKLLNRLTDPDKGPLTYDEARLFQSNISRLSADEAQRLTPVMKRQVGQIAGELGSAVESTAADAGKLDQFRSAMQEYSKAKQMEARGEALKDAVINAAKHTIPAAGAYYGVKKLLDQ